MGCRKRHRFAKAPLRTYFFLVFVLTAVQGGALWHSSVLVALTGSIFESNMAGKDGLAVMSLGMVGKIAGLSFRNNSFYCASGKYGLEKKLDEVKVWKPSSFFAVFVSPQQYTFVTESLSQNIKNIIF